MWICPLCGQPLIEQEQGWVCGNRHGFDRARSGYVHLLPSNQMHGKLPGDNKLMVTARQRFLEGKYYQPLAEAVSAAASDGLPPGARVLDVGCGEGYYTDRLFRSLQKQKKRAEVYGIDISKIAVDKAAHRNKEIRWAVASAFHLPVADSSCNLVSNLFAPYCGEELHRVLRKDGVLVMVIPGEDHLWELKQAVYDQPYKNQVKSFELKGFDLTDTQQLHYAAFLPDNRTIQDLFMMTPYYYKTGQQDQEKLEAVEHLNLTVHFYLLTYRRHELFPE